MRTKNNLSATVEYNLIGIMMAEYTQSRLTDAEFAATMAKRLGATVTPHNVAGIRQRFQIPSNYKSNATASKETANLVALVHEQEERIAKCEDDIDELRRRAGLPRRMRPDIPAQTNSAELVPR